ncbi:TPR repeat, SEL1 subfamily [hydrothermal vent metagenome]|uniref:TPR repeat, SEL1 subfamily n=1 Tax=hydrothermal vent metagenome TaxID=652676 RepID=A0A3B0UI74_9ZZZZ
MALAQNNNYFESEPGAPASQEWDALHNELQTLLEQVELHQQTRALSRPRIPSLGSYQTNSYEANPAQPALPTSDYTALNERRQHPDRRQQALSSVQQAIERFDKPKEASPMPTHSQNQLQTAIDQIRASQNQFASRQQVRPGNGPRPVNGPRTRAPAPANSSNQPGHNQIDQISLALSDIGARFTRLETNIGSQHNSTQALQDMASQLEQLSAVVELLANSIGERSHIKRLETQISKLADAVGNGSEIDFYSIDERLGILSGAFERLSQLHSEQLQTMERDDDARHMQDMHLQEIQSGVHSLAGRLDDIDIRAIENSVRAIYDRIDALEANMSAPLPAIERLSRELADFSKALRDEKGPAVSSSLVDRVDVLNQRISQIEDSGQPVEALKINIKELHQAVVGAMEPRFAALEDKIGALSGQFADNQDAGLPDISVEGLEKQIRLLADKMDQTSSELNGLQRLYSDQEKTDPAPDIGAMAELVAKRAAQAVEKAQEQQPAAASPDAMAQLETRLSSLFDKSKIDGAQQGFSRVQNSIEQVNQRLERLEASLKNADLNDSDADDQPSPEPSNETIQETAIGQDFIQEPTESAPLPSETISRPDSPAHPGLNDSSAQEYQPPAPRRSIPDANDAMPKPPSEEAPLNSPPYPDPSFGDFRVPIPRHLRTGEDIPQIDRPGNVEFDQTAPEPVESRKTGSERIKLPLFERESTDLPPAPSSSLAAISDNKDSNVGDSVEQSTPPQPGPDSASQTGHENISRSTFIQAARRAAQRNNPEPAEKDEQSLIARALARFKNKQAGNKPAKEANDGKLWQKKPLRPKPAPDALSKKEHLEEMASDEQDDQTPDAGKPMPDEFDIDDISIRDTSGEQSFLNRHRQLILLVAALVTIALLTINLIRQRSLDPVAPASAISSDQGATTTPQENQPAQSVEQPGAQVDSASPSGGPPAIDTGAITGSIEGFSGTPGSNIRIIDPTAIAQMPAQLKLASINSDQITASPLTLELPPTAIGPMALRKAAAAGDPRAQFEVGAIYAEGKATAQDLGAAARWYQRAASQGFAPAAYRLGNMYENGVGIDKNLEQAALWYKLGAEAGNRMAMHNLASLLASGSLGKQRFAEAAQWFEKAARLGLKDSQFNLGMLYARGLGVTQDMQTSFKWFSIAAGTGDQDAAKAAQDIASSLDPALVARLKGELTNWAPANMNIAANFAPIGTWSAKFNPGPAIKKPDVILQVQAALNRIGFDAGKPDGVIGPKTAKAIEAFEKALGMSQSGTVNPRLLAVLGSQPV